MGDRIGQWLKYCFGNVHHFHDLVCSLSNRLSLHFPPAWSVYDAPLSHVGVMKLGCCLCCFAIREARINEGFCTYSVIAWWPESFCWRREAAFKTSIPPNCNTVWLSRAIFCTSLIIILLYFKPQNRSLLVQVWELDLVCLNLASKQVPSLRQQNVPSLQAELLGPAPTDLFSNDPASVRLLSTSVGEPCVEGRKFRRQEFLEQQEEGGMTGRGDWYFAEEPITNSARITVLCHGYRFPYLGALSGGACRHFCLAPCSALSRLQIQSGLNKFQCSLLELPRTPQHGAVRHHWAARWHHCQRPWRRFLCHIPDWRASCQILVILHGLFRNKWANFSLTGTNTFLK